MDYIIQKFAKLTLYLMGWNKFNEKDFVQKIKRNKRVILAISHTSVWDAIIFLLYKYAYPDTLSNSVIVVKPQIYNSLPKLIQPLLNRIGFIKATAYEDKNGGFVKTVSETLKDRDRFLFIISPKGKRENSPWRSGYFAIAKELGCDIMACGVDYETKEIIFFDPVSTQNKSKEEVEVILKKQMSEIIPLYTECSEVPLRKHNKRNITIITFSTIILLFILFMTYLSWQYKTLFIIAFILLIIFL